MAQIISSRTVVLLLLASFAVLGGAATKPSDWHVCDRHANYDISVKNVTINPDPVVSGEEMTFMVPAYTAKEINGGSVIVSVSFHGITVHTEKSDICERAGCPIAPGEFVLKNTEILPGITPPGNYRIRLQFLGEKSEQLSCVDINFSIIWNTFESYNRIELHKKIAKNQAPTAHA